MFTTSTDETLDEQGNVVKMNRSGSTILGMACGGRGAGRARELSDADSDAELDNEQAGMAADKQLSKIDDEQVRSHYHCCIVASQSICNQFFLLVDFAYKKNFCFEVNQSERNR